MKKELPIKTLFQINQKFKNLEPKVSLKLIPQKENAPRSEQDLKKAEPKEKKKMR